MRVYISGPMTGLPYSNFPAFNETARSLRSCGLDVVNPAEINPDGAKSWSAYMRADIAALVTCDAIALMPGWENSNGAHLELHIAHRLARHARTQGLHLLARDKVALHDLGLVNQVARTSREP